jgi:hypothetical protein
MLGLIDPQARATLSQEYAAQLAASYGASRPRSRMRQRLGTFLVGAGLRLAPDALAHPQPPGAAAGA